MDVVSAGDGSAQDADTSPVVRWRWVLALFTASGLLRFAYLYLDDVTRARSGTLAIRLIEESTGAYAAMLLFPAIAWAERRFPFSVQRWRRSWLPHLGVLLAYSAMHTTLLAASRRAIFAAVGLGRYDYGLMRWRYLMELPSDVLGYATLVGLLTALRVHASLRERDRRVSSLAHETTQARLESLTFRLQPHFLFNALNTISATMYSDPVTADGMISHLGDLLRHALRTSEQQQISIAEELEVLRAYLAIIEARFGDRLRCEVVVEERVTGLAIDAAASAAARECRPARDGARGRRIDRVGADRAGRRGSGGGRRERRGRAT